MKFLRKTPSNALLICSLIAAIVRILYLMEQSQTSVLFYQPTLDEQEMVLTAQALLRGEGFGATPLFKAPLYPVLVATSQVFFGEAWFWGLRFLQHLGGVLVVAMGIDVAGRLMGGSDSRRNLAAWFTGLALALYAPLIRLENRLVLDFTVVFLQSAMIWASLRWLTAEQENTHTNRWLLTAGGFGALAWLTRPTITPVLPLFGLLLILLRQMSDPKVSRKRVGAVLLFLGLPLLTMTGVILRNAIVGGDAMLLPWQGGYNLYHANRAGATGRYFVQEAFADSASGNPTTALMVQGYRQAVTTKEQPAVDDPKTYRAINKYWTGRLWVHLRENPDDWLMLMLQKSLYLVSTREIFNFEDFALQKDESPILRKLPFSFGWLWPLALASLALPIGTNPRARGVRWMLWAYLILMGGAIALVFVSGRLRMPLVFPAAILAGGGLAACIALFQKRPKLNSRAVVLPILLFGLGILMSQGDWWGVRTEQVAHHDLARMSGAAWRQGRYDLALDYALRAETLAPAYPRLPILKAQALYSLERIDEAEIYFLQAMNEQPGDAAPAFNLGLIAYDTHKDPQQAIKFFQEALRRNPGHESAQAYLALSYLKSGAIEDAVLSIKPLLSKDTQPSLLTRITIVAVLRETGQDQAGLDYYNRWLAPLNEDIRNQADQELDKILRKMF